MIRKVIIVALTVGTLLACASWPLSYLAPIALTFELCIEGAQAECRDGQGTLQLGLQIDAATFNSLNLRPYSLIAGFGYGSELIIAGEYKGKSREYLRIRKLHAPIWAVVLLLAAYPTVAFIRGPLRRYRRWKRGLCLKCGYDLTGNVSGVCPECGTKVNE